LERAGLPTVQVSTMTPVAVMVGANRIVPAAGIIHPLGHAELSPEEEKALRRRIVERALQALQTEVARPTVFAGDDPLSRPGAPEGPRA
jgi:betaine reductase